MPGPAVSFCSAGNKNMAPSISLGSAATALSTLILAASNIGMWLPL
eukprot:COSAG04_NODE_904_length_9520_cov_6.614584_2_plen_46_part_00